MSKIIAPGQWDDDKRTKAKFIAPFIGFAMVVAGAALAYVLIVKALEAGRDINVVAAAIPLAFMAIGAAAVFPNVVVPIAYRLIDKWGKDSE